MDPLGIGLLIGGAVLNADAQDEAGEEARRQAYRNAAFLDAQASFAERAGQDKAAIILAKGEETAGMAKTVMGASGTLIDEAVLLQTRFMASWEANYAKANARIEAWGLRKRASILRQSGDAAEQTGDLNAMASLLGGGLQAYDAYSQRSKPPTFNYSYKNSFTPSPINSEYTASSIGTIR